MALAQTKIYAEDDYYCLPEDVRAELIDGHIYYQATPSRIHQRLLSDLHGTIYNYIKSNNVSCQVYPAPFAVKLFDDGENYAFVDNIPVGIYPDFCINLSTLNI